jgi:cell division protease FtsH
MSARPSPPEPQDAPDPGSGQPPEGPGAGPQPRRRIPILYVMIAAAVLILLYSAASQTNYESMDYGRFRSALIAGQVSRVVLEGGKVRGELREKPADRDTSTFVANMPPNDDALYGLLQEHLGADWDVKSNRFEGWLMWLLPFALLLVFWRFIFSRANPMSGAMEFGQSRAQVYAEKTVPFTFDDVAGIEECKQELQEIVEFLKNPTKFTRLGGRIPKGVLLIGPPGTGKTLLAKAVAGEAGVTFFSLSGSDFVEMFVGMGAARVRSLFEQANKAAPAIIFIDELDALGKTRGTGILGGHDEREQTLNALLVQMDGFATQKGVIILAATNRPEMLDPALLRPGRFDRQVVVPVPDLRDREQILQVHTRDVSLGDEVDLRKLAAMTPGFVGADLANLVNEATLLAARREQDVVRMADFQDSIDRVVAGLEKRSRLMNSEEKAIVAHHEAGHALLASLLPGADPVRKVSMIPRGIAALGYTMQMPTEDRYLLRRGELMDRITVMLGGRSAEEVVFGEISTGAQNDLQHATELAREMVTQFGMSDELGPLAYAGRNNGRFGFEMPGPPEWSERTARQIDEEIKAIVDAAHEKAVALLREHRSALDALAAALIEREAIEGEALSALLREQGIEPRTARPDQGAVGGDEPAGHQGGAQEAPQPED